MYFSNTGKNGAHYKVSKPKRQPYCEKPLRKSEIPYTMWVANEDIDHKYIYESHQGK
jgi:hypothetical protein